MATFTVKGRKSVAFETEGVEADTREQAVDQVVKAAAPEENILVMDVTQTSADAAGATGATGATGPAE